MLTTAELVKREQASKKLHAALEAYEKWASTGEPLKQAAEDAQKEYDAIHGTRSARGKSSGSGEKRAYSISPENAIAKAKKTAETRAKNAGKSGKEIAAAGREAEANMKAKLGV